MKRINKLLRELKRCEYAHLLDEAPSTYNGFTRTQSIEGYSKHLSRLFDEAADALCLLTDEQKVIYRQRLQEVRKEQGAFDVPSEETLDTINAELQTNKNTGLRQEQDFILFVRGCVSTQKDYTNRLFKYLIPSDSGQDSITEEEIHLTPLPQEEHGKTYDSEWAYGYNEISTVFHWGRNKTNQFLKNPRYAMAIQRDGRKIAVNIPKARALMQIPITNQAKRHK